MTDLTELQSGDWMDRDNATRLLWASPTEQPPRQADPLVRLRAIRADGARAAGGRAMQKGRMLKVVRYVQAAEHDAGAQFEVLELVAQSRHWLVRDEACQDPAPALLEYRSGLTRARRLLRAGFADGLLAPTWEHISPHLAEYERFLRDMETHGWFLGLASSETGR